MKLNCKPGDLAIIVIGAGFPGSEHGGKIVQVTNLRNIDTWTYEPLLAHPSGGFYEGIVDDFLRPIRDPGRDAVDETISWLPVPLPELELA